MNCINLDKNRSGSCSYLRFGYLWLLQVTKLNQSEQHVQAATDGLRQLFRPEIDLEDFVGQASDQVRIQMIRIQAQLGPFSGHGLVRGSTSRTYIQSIMDVIA